MEKEKILKRKKEAVREDRKWDVVMVEKNKGRGNTCPVLFPLERKN